MKLKNGRIIYLTLRKVISSDIKKLLYKNDPIKYYLYSDYYRRNKYHKKSNYKRKSPW